MISTTTASVASALAAIGFSRCASDLDGHNREAFDGMTFGRSRITFAMLGDERALDANTTLRQYEITVWLHARIDGGAAERDYTEGSMDTAMRLLASPAWWRGRTGVFDVVGDQQGITIIEAEREGWVVTFGARVRITVTV